MARPQGRRLISVGIVAVMAAVVVPSAAAAASQWGHPRRLSPVGASDPAVAADARGDAVVAWSRPDLSTGTNRIEAVIRTPHAWHGRREIGRSNPLLGDAPVVAMDRLGDAFAAWYGIDNAVHAAVEPRAGSWAGTAIGAASGPPVLAVDAVGDAALAFVDLGRVEVALRPAHGAWSAPRVLSSPSSPSELPQIAMSAAGDIAVAWLAGLPGARNQLQVAVKPAHHDFRPVQALTPSSGHVMTPALASDRAGDMVAVWVTGPTASRTVSAAVRVAGRASFGAPSRLATQALIGQPDVGVSDRGRAVVSWISRDVNVVRRSTGGVWSRPRRISPAGREITSTVPFVAVDPRGDATVAWSGSPRPPGPLFAILVANQRARHAFAKARSASRPTEQDPERPAVALASAHRGVLAWRSRSARHGFVIWASLRR